MSCRLPQKRCRCQLPLCGHGGLTLALYVLILAMAYTAERLGFKISVDKVRPVYSRRDPFKFRFKQDLPGCVTFTDGTVPCVPGHHPRRIPGGLVMGNGAVQAAMYPGDHPRDGSFSSSGHNDGGTPRFCAAVHSYYCRRSYAACADCAASTRPNTSYDADVKVDAPSTQLSDSALGGRAFYVAGYNAPAGGNCVC